MEDLMVIINLLALVYVGWFVDWAIKKNKSKGWLFASLAIIMLAVLATLPNYGPIYSYIMLSGILMYVILTVSWTMFSGPTGYISLAPAAFFGVGIYTSAILGKDFSVPVVVIFGGLLSMVLAVIVGAITLRLKGIYFIVFTFGLVLFISSALLWYEIKFTGTRGRFITTANNDLIYYIMLAITVFMFFTAYLIKRSKYGLALQSIGQNEEAAAHMGINVTAVKIMIFSISAIFMGMAGAIMAMKWIYSDPYSAFDPFRSFLPVLMAIFGGMKRSYGPVLGAVILAFLEEKLLTQFPYYYKLSFGIVLILVIIYLPDGMVGVVEKVRTWFSRGKNALA
jgi:branched-chain amino acid transport system permease protein